MTQIPLEKRVPVIDRYDVVVCGAGPAGIAAAVSSARMGKKVILLERYGIIGGCLTSAHVGPTMGRVGKGAITTEINALLGGDPSIKMAFDPEQAKIKLTNFVHAAGCKLSLQTPVVDVIMDQDTLTGVVIGTHEGLRAIHGTIFIDATGDGPVSFLAGAGYKKGRDEDGLMQPVTLMFRLNGVDESKQLHGDNWTYDIRMPKSTEAKWFRNLCVEASKSGDLPPYASLVRLYRTSRPGECLVNASQTNFIDGTSADDIEKAEIDLREQINTITEFLKAHVEGFENCFVQNSATTLGVRDTRRIIGEYVRTEDDLFNGRRFEDVVVHDAWYPQHHRRRTDADPRAGVRHPLPVFCAAPDRKPDDGGPVHIRNPRGGGVLPDHERMHGHGPGRGRFCKPVRG